MQNSLLHGISGLNMFVTEFNENLNAQSIVGRYGDCTSQCLTLGLPQIDFAIHFLTLNIFLDSIKIL